MGFGVNNTQQSGGSYGLPSSSSGTQNDPQAQVMQWLSQFAQGHGQSGQGGGMGGGQGMGGQGGGGCHGGGMGGQGMGGAGGYGNYGGGDSWSTSSGGYGGG